MKTTIFRNPEKLGINEVIDLFKDSLEKSEVFSESEIDLLAETYAKNPVDKFIVAEELSGSDDACQGDIIVLGEKTNMYKENYPRVKGGKETDRIIPAEGSTYTVKQGKFTPKFLEGKNMWGREAVYNAISFTTDKPFLIFHREHGNMAYTAGKYMFYSQLDPDTLDRMMD